MNGYIAKDDLIELLSDMQGRCGTRAELRQNSKIWQQVKDMPTADAVSVRHGKWLGFPEALQFEALTEDDIACSVCGHSFNMIDNNTEEFNYCPHCGARMDEE